MKTQIIIARTYRTSPESRRRKSVTSPSKRVQRMSIIFAVWEEPKFIRRHKMAYAPKNPPRMHIIQWRYKVCFSDSIL
jgi:hypothetical protein